MPYNNADLWYFILMSKWLFHILGVDVVCWLNDPLLLLHDFVIRCVVDIFQCFIYHHVSEIKDNLLKYTYVFCSVTKNLDTFMILHTQIIYASTCTYRCKHVCTYMLLHMCISTYKLVDICAWMCTYKHRGMYIHMSLDCLASGHILLVKCLPLDPFKLKLCMNLTLFEIFQAKIKIYLCA